ncbi:hypothetical protein LTR78_010599, partial [Recurvomyces mirabilis]
GATAANMSDAVTVEVDTQCCGRCAKTLPATDFGATQTTCNACRAQISAYGKAKRAAARAEREHKRNQNHLRDPPPIYPGSEVRVIPQVVSRDFVDITSARDPDTRRESVHDAAVLKHESHHDAITDMGKSRKAHGIGADQAAGIGNGTNWGRLCLVTADVTGVQQETV